ncbi:MAG: NAD(P)-binding protein [Chloroflexi bacterium]|nr:NAD(P)-binding protein [Chloroflexota bacterium]
MRIENDALLREHYDVIIVGAGLGGLTAASLLAKRGLGVLLIDQQDRPGGSCTSFRRDDIVFDVGTAMLYGFGEKGFKPFRFVLNELEEPLDVIAHATLARMTFEGREIVFWPDLDRFLDELGDLYPEERDSLRAFYADLWTMYENIVIKNEIIAPPSEFSPRQGLRQVLSGPLALFKMQSLLNTSVRTLLDRYFSTPGIIHFFDKLCSAYCYCTAAETPAVLAATMYLDNHYGGVYYPAGGAQMLPNALERAFERYGGQTLYRRLVDEIILSGRPKRATGVRLADGTCIAADRVVANVTVWNLYGKLVRPEHIAPERLAWARGLVPTFPSMLLYMLVDRAALPAGVLPWEVFIERAEAIDSTDLTLYVNSLVDETLAPAGQLAITAIAPNMEPWPAPTDPAYRTQAYADHKQQAAEGMLAQIEQHYPGFRAHIRELIVGTPTTIERYLLKNGGAVGGPKNSMGQHMLKRLHARSEWRNLYICGDSTVMATGAPATVVSGVGAANVILRDLSMRDYDTRPFAAQFVHYVDSPYRRPAVVAGEAINPHNAWLWAAQCQGCEHPACVAACPAGLDIPGMLRRIEARNVAGAARLARERVPLAEICGHVCPTERLCERRCYRRTFADAPVRIADLQAWVCREAGEAGWPQPDITPHGKPVAVVGAGPAGLSCAYYLNLLGWRVDLYDGADQPGGYLRSLPATLLPPDARERDLQGCLRGVDYHGGQAFASAAQLRELASGHTALFLALGADAPLIGELESWLGADWRQRVDPATQQLQGHPGIYAGGDLRQRGDTVVQAVADGRRAAIAIAAGTRPA